MSGTGDGTESNKPTISWVTRTICILGFLLGSSVPVLGYLDKPISSELNTLAGIVIGGLLSMLTKSTPTASTTLVHHEQKPAGEITVPAQKLETTT